MLDLLPTGGIQSYNQTYIRALQDLGHDIQVLSLHDKALKNTATLPLRSFGDYGALKKPAFLVETFRQVLWFRPDLLLCGHIHLSPVGLFFKKMLHIPYYTMTYGREVWSMPRAITRTVGQSDRLLTISRFTRDKILEAIPGYPPGDIHFVQPMVDETQVVARDKPAYLIKRWGFSGKEKIIFTLARMSMSYKGYDRVLLAFKELIGEFDNLRYILGGSGEDRPRLERLIKGLNIEDRVVMTGFIPDEEIPDYYNLCDIFIMPSKKEGFGIVFLEAMACGKPVIAGNADGSTEPTMNGRLGRLVDPDDIADIRIAMKEALTGQAVMEGPELADEVIKHFGYRAFRTKVSQAL